MGSGSGVAGLGSALGTGIAGGYQEGYTGTLPGQLAASPPMPEEQARPAKRARRPCRAGVVGLVQRT